jgi:arsenate reductase
MITLYGIPNCETVKKARTWLAEQGLDYRFHDFRKAGVPAERLDDWLERFGWETVINRRGTSWRRLPAEQREAMNNTRAREAALANPSLIRRPVLEHEGTTLIGFSTDDWQKALA